MSFCISLFSQVVRQKTALYQIKYKVLVTDKISSIGDYSFNTGGRTVYLTLFDQTMTCR